MDTRDKPVNLNTQKYLKSLTLLENFIMKPKIAASHIIKMHLPVNLFQDRHRSRLWCGRPRKSCLYTSRCRPCRRTWLVVELLGESRSHQGKDSQLKTKWHEIIQNWFGNGSSTVWGFAGFWLLPLNALQILYPIVNH